MRNPEWCIATLKSTWWCALEPQHMSRALVLLRCATHQRKHIWVLASILALESCLEMAWHISSHRPTSPKRCLMKMPLYGPESWVLRIICEIGQAFGMLQWKPATHCWHQAQSFCSNNSPWLGNPKRHRIPGVAASIMCRLPWTCDHSA